MKKNYPKYKNNSYNFANFPNTHIGFRFYILFYLISINKKNNKKKT